MMNDDNGHHLLLGCHVAVGDVAPGFWMNDVSGRDGRFPHLGLSSSLSFSGSWWCLWAQVDGGGWLWWALVFVCGYSLSFVAICLFGVFGHTVVVVRWAALNTHQISFQTASLFSSAMPCEFLKKTSTTTGVFSTTMSGTCLLLHFLVRIILCSKRMDGFMALVL